MADVHKHEHKTFDRGEIVSTRDLGFDESYDVMVQRHWEGGWMATCPTAEAVGFGPARDTALKNLVDNIQTRRLHWRLVHEPMPPEDAAKTG